MRFIRSFTLKELSLKTVIKHLDLFIYNENYLIPQRHIEFLFRLYSKECFCQYTNSHSKTEECLLWFLTAPNKNVFLPRVTQNIMDRLQTVGPAITSLTLRETMATENVLHSVLCCVPQLSYLDLSNTNCSDKTLLCIQKMCPNLLTLNVQGCQDVTDDGMLNLCGNNLSLKNLNVLYSSVEYMGLHDILKRMRSLECLTYDNIADTFYYLHDDSEVQFFVQQNIKYNLTEFIYEDMEFSQDPMKVMWAWTALCPNVKKVHILFPVDYDVLEMCSRFSQLEELKLKPKYDFEDFLDLGDFKSFEIPDPLTPFLPIANNLTTLILCDVEIQPVTLLECFKNVKDLRLERASITDFDENEIKSESTNLYSLTVKNLHLDTNHASYKFLSLLISLSKNVAELVISRMDYFPNEFIDLILNSMKNLTFVEFSFIRTRLPPSFRKFFEIPTVQQVYLDGCMAPFTGPVHISSQSCTLSWRIMNDSSCDEDEDDDNFEDFENDDMSEL